MARLIRGRLRTGHGPCAKAAAAMAAPPRPRRHRSLNLSFCSRPNCVPHPLVSRGWCAFVLAVRHHSGGNVLYGFWSLGNPEMV